MEFHSWGLQQSQGDVKLMCKPADKKDPAAGHVYFLRFIHPVLLRA